MSQRHTAEHGFAEAAEPQCVITHKWLGRTAVIGVSGEVDALTAPELDAAIAALLPDGPAAIIVDLSDVQFLASAGMAVLVAAREKSDGQFRFAVVADGPATSRPLRLVGLADLIGLYPTLDQARADLGDTD